MHTNMKLSNQFSTFITMKNRFLTSLLLKIIILVALFFVLNPSACKKEDVGKCTIQIHGGDDEVYDNIGIEECQNIFGNTVGARGWKWEPKN